MANFKTAVMCYESGQEWERGLLEEETTFAYPQIITFLDKKQNQNTQKKPHKKPQQLINPPNSTYKWKRLQKLNVKIDIILEETREGSCLIHIRNRNIYHIL